MKKLSRLSLPATWLLVMLERTPVTRVAPTVAEAITSRVASLMKATFASTASLGALHTLAGATEFVVSNSNVFGTVGTAITPVAFTVTGATIPAGSFRITGPLPPGLTVPNANGNGDLNGSTGVITGTPTAAGTYLVSITAYELPNVSGDPFGPTQIGFLITNTASAPPTIIAQPASQSVSTGTTMTLSVVAAGSPTPTFQWRKNGTLVTGATNATLVVPDVQPSDAGAYTVVISNLIGIVSSSPATVAVTAAAPAITLQPQSQHIPLGGAVTLSTTASGTGLRYQWSKDGVAIAGANSATFNLVSASAGNMGFYAVAISGEGGTTNSAVATVTVNTGGTSRLQNVSTRGYIPAGGALTPGFVLQGRPSKSVVIRGIGPTLGSFGVSGTLADPMIEVIPLGSAVPVAANDNWGGIAALTSAFARVGAFPLVASGSSDATVQTSLPANGASGYTVRISSANPGAAGIALAEVYDDDAPGSSVRLINVSTNGYVGSGEQALVPGFFIGGDAPKRLVIRAVGPSLTRFGVTGVLPDPQLTIVPLGKDLVVAANDNWGGTAELENAFSQAGAFPLTLGSNDAAVQVRLPPGGYTVVVSGVGGTTGSALVEVYDLDP